MGRRPKILVVHGMQVFKTHGQSEPKVGVFDLRECACLFVDMLHQNDGMCVSVCVCAQMSVTQLTEEYTYICISLCMYARKIESE